MRLPRPHLKRRFRGGAGGGSRMCRWFLFFIFFLHPPPFFFPFVSEAPAMYLVASASFIAFLGALGFGTLRCTEGSESFSPSCFLRPRPLPPPEARTPRGAGGQAWASGLAAILEQLSRSASGQRAGLQRCSGEGQGSSGPRSERSARSSLRTHGAGSDS